MLLYIVIGLLVLAVVFWLELLFFDRKERGSMSVQSTILSKHKRHEKHLEMIGSIIPEVETAFAEISSFYNYGHYITESERKSLDKKYEELNGVVAKFLKYKELDEIGSKDLFLRFNDALSNSKAHKKANNEHFVEGQLSNCAHYFDNVLAHPLDVQQREAILALEDNVLVISSAGSGKTMTTVGKVRYLIDVQKVPAERILLITFTRKAADSLSERLGEKDLKCRTFHKLALDIIAEVTGEKPSITTPDFPVQVYHRLMEENPDFKMAVADYIVNSRYTMRDMFEYSSREDYISDRRKHGVQAYYKDMDGHPVFCKSDQESRICDFLGSRGIRFRYEEKYEVDTSDAEYRQYCPDFSIYIPQADGTSRRVYLEHLAVNEYGRCPRFFSAEEEYKYLQGIEWKRNLHRRNGTVLIETTSAEFSRGEVFPSITRQLLQLGAVFSNATQDSISHELQRQEESILGMLTAFVFLMKSRNKMFRDIRKDVRDWGDAAILDGIIYPFADAYDRMKKERGEIDFTDAIVRATGLCNNGYNPDYDYILVDEFQDISLDRYRFLQALRRREPLTKLFCVGDDWQSIYRFAGSDMALFKRFQSYFGYTRKCLMETTYRFGEPAISDSSKFILSNPEQAVKNVRSFRSDAVTKLDFLSTQGTEDIIDTVKYLIDQVPLDKEILLLGRYGFDIGVLKNSDIAVHTVNGRYVVSYHGRQMDFMTVHQSKGLESDYVILLNCNGGTLGFPSQVSDSPVLKYVLSEPDAYAFSEERRIFYVGITRAKKQTWVLYDMNKPSAFVKEFVPTLAAEPLQEEQVPEEELCPKCRCGRVRIIKKGKACNGNPYTMYACSNERYGCDYFETRFVNLNSIYHTQRRRIG